MLVKSYGLFWQRDEVIWNPGQGNKGAFRLLGRRGTNLPGLRLADFRHQVGIYVLYGNYGPHYVGLTTKQGLGKRLKDHLYDEHSDSWDRFSWFGFCQVLKAKDHHGFPLLKEAPKSANGSPERVIHEMEALLIKAMGLRNKAEMKFNSAEQWVQVKRDEVDHFCGKAIG